MNEIISLLVPLAKSAYEAVTAAIARGRASGELTAEQEKAYLDDLNSGFNQDYMKNDATRAKV
jgi:hypothetical protein